MFLGVKVELFHVLYEAMKKYVGVKVVNIINLGMAVSGVIDGPAAFIPLERDVVICCVGGCVECGTAVGVMVKRNIPLGPRGIKHCLPSPYPCCFAHSASVA
jgi:hypothetical protein